MGLFGKKEKKSCPICGGELTFFKSKRLADGAICEGCEALLRGQFPAVGTGAARQEDPMEELTVEQALALIARKQQETADAVSALGGSYANLFKGEKAFAIAPGALEVGLKRAKLLKNKGVLQGFVMAGSFHQGDSVQLKRGDSLTPTVILELIPITNTAEFDTELGANSHKKTVDVNANAWMILDIEGTEVRGGDMLVK